MNPIMHTLYVTRDIDGGILIHTEMPRRDEMGFWNSNGETITPGESPILAGMLYPYTAAVRHMHPIAVCVSVAASAVNSLIRP